MRHTTFPILLIVGGVLWLANDFGWFPNWHLVGAAALIVIGVLILFTEGINRSSVVSGPMLIYAGAAWLGYLEGLIPWHAVWPVGVILLGILILIGRHPALPCRVRRMPERTTVPPAPPL